VVAIFSEQMLIGVQPTIFGDGNKTRDYLYIDDVVSANLRAIDGAGDGDLLNLGWGREIRDSEVFDTVRESLGLTVEPRWAAKRPGELERVALDSRKARKVLGWEPEVSFEEGIARTVAYHRRRKA
jgi:UDP-glucose 4-epimerase